MFYTTRKILILVLIKSHRHYLVSQTSVIIDDSAEYEIGNGQKTTDM